MTIFKEHWLTGLLVLAACALTLLSVASFSATDPEFQDEDRVTGVVAAVAALVLLLGSVAVWRRQDVGSGDSHSAVTPTTDQALHG